MKVSDIMSSAKDTITVKRVFAEPIEKDGVTIIPAAVIGGGGGGGGGHGDDGQEGEGGGFGVGGRPAGALVIKEGKVTWRPAVDPNRMILVVGAAIVAYLVMRPRMVRARAKADKIRGT